MTDKEIRDRLTALDEERAQLTALLRGNRYARLAEARARGFTTEDLVLADTSRCKCGALLAYPKDIGPDGSWSCARVLLDPNQSAAAHDEPMPFRFWEVKSRRGAAPTVAEVLGVTVTSFA